MVKVEVKELHKKNQFQQVAQLLGLLVVLFFVSFLGLRLGSYDMDLAEIIKGALGKATDQKVNLIIQNMRLPRIGAAVIGGAGLGVTGCILQSVLRNPMASGSTVGISAGASFGAALFVLTPFVSTVTITLSAFLCSMVVALLILGLSRTGKMTSSSIILAGIAISSMLQGATTLLQFFANEVDLSVFIFWTFGDLGKVGYQELLLMAVAVFVPFLYFLLNRWKYNALSLGDETALSLGVDVRRLSVSSILLCALTIAVIISHLGTISFVGLLAPHISRIFSGENHAYLIPGSALVGGILLVLGDILSRMLIPPVILPIGAITAFLGAPLFLVLLLKGGKKHA
ncbi:MAG TPA: iron ABC transporter permease [Candidatus Dorea intestinavium]|nr:iron ABC transporter permease [Candidatus Dorea intestinavium]